MNNIIKRHFNNKFKIKRLEDSNNSSKPCIITGLAVVFDSPAIINDSFGEYQEKISKKALDECDMTDVVLNFNHNNDCLLARTSNGSLKLNISDKGLEFEAEIHREDEDFKKILSKINTNLLTDMSFCGIIKEDIWNSKCTKCEILSLSKIFDISFVTRGAYKDTNLNVKKRSASLIREEYFNNIKKEELLNEFEKITRR